MYALYCSDPDYLTRLILSAIAGVDGAHGTEGVRQALEVYRPADTDCLHTLRAKFLVLLDQDEATRVRLTTYRPPGVRDLVPLCPAKANRFYADLHKDLLPGWVRDETVSLSDFVDRARMTYLIS